MGDVVITDPCAPSTVVQAATTSGLTARNAVSDKVRVYGDWDRGVGFVPLAVEFFGGLDNLFDNFLRDCAHHTSKLRGSGGPPPSLFAVFYRQQVSVALQRVQASALLRQTNLADAEETRLHGLPDRPPIHIDDLVC